MDKEKLMLVIHCLTGEETTQEVQAICDRIGVKYIASDDVDNLSELLKVYEYKKTR